MQNKMTLYEDGLEKYPKSTIFIENLTLFIWIILGATACWYFNSVIALLYIFFALSMIIFVMRKLVCTRCYYYGKWCHVGWGKISALFFKKGNEEEFQSCTGLKIAPVFFVLLALIPVILVIISSIKSFLLIKIIILLTLLIVVIFSSVILRKKSCALCKMKSICPGSAI